MTSEEFGKRLLTLVGKTPCCQGDPYLAQAFVDPNDFRTGFAVYCMHPVRPKLPPGREGELVRPRPHNRCLVRVLILLDGKLWEQEGMIDTLLREIRATGDKVWAEGKTVNVRV